MKNIEKWLIYIVGFVFLFVFVCCGVQERAKQRQKKSQKIENVELERIKSEDKDIQDIKQPKEAEEKIEIEIEEKEKIVVIENAGKILEEVKTVIASGKVIEDKGGWLVNLNDLFKVLKHISLKEEYVLDYVYRYTGGGGCPYVYGRKKEAVPLYSYEEYEKKFSDYQGDEYIKNWHLLIRIDGTPESYFEMFVLVETANNFGLIWHELYRQRDIVPDNKSAEKLPEEIQDKIQDIDFSPRIIFQGNRVTVSYIIFYNWGGVFRNTAILEIPATVLNKEKFFPIFISGKSKRLVEYSSPICL